MPPKRAPKQLIPLLKGSVETFMTHPVILFPFVTIAFIQLLILEVLYFAPRFPLSAFFNPIVKTLWGEKFVHYPHNFVVLPKLFQYVQVPVYIFVNSFFIAAAMAVIAAVNNGRRIRFRAACRDAFSRYVHVFAGALISFCTFYGFYKIYHLLMTGALKISSVKGPFLIIKTTMAQGAPYINLLIGSFVTALFAFVFPIIVIEKKKIFPAIGLSFKHLRGAFGFVFLVVLVPTLFYLPVVLLRNNVAGAVQAAFPEFRVLALVFSVVVTMFIDATVYTAVTTFYLLKKEHP